MRVVSLTTPATLGHLKVLAAKTDIVFVVMKLLILKAHHVSVTLPVHLYKRCGLKRKGGASSRLHVLDSIAEWYASKKNDCRVKKMQVVTSNLYAC